MTIQRNQGIGKNTSVAYDRISQLDEKKGSIRAYSAENWKKVSFFRRLISLILGSVTEVDIGNEKFFVVKRSLAKQSNERVITQNQAFQLLAKLIGAEVEYPTRAGRFALSYKPTKKEEVVKPEPVKPVIQNSEVKPETKIEPIVPPSEPEPNQKPEERTEEENANSIVLFADEEFEGPLLSESTFAKALRMFTSVGSQTLASTWAATKFSGNMILNLYNALPSRTASVQERQIVVLPTPAPFAIELPAHHDDYTGPIIEEMSSDDVSMDNEPEFVDVENDSQIDVEGSASESDDEVEFVDVEEEISSEEEAAPQLVIDIASGSAAKRSFMRMLQQIMNKNITKNKMSQALSFGTRLNPLFLSLSAREQEEVKEYFKSNWNFLKSHFTKDAVTAMYASEKMTLGAGLHRK